MRLVQPTDFEILATLADGKRNTAANIAAELNKKRPYINTRLPILADYDLIQKIGPADQSGLYVITERGQTALSLRDQYKQTDNFEALLSRHLRQQ
ncbi:MAG: ArsR family transcriptional regulator [Halorhabdus sp.]